MAKITKSKIEHSYFHSIELEGIGCFKEKQFLDLSDGKGNYSPWTLILGDNGTGKTTLLRTIERQKPINHNVVNDKNDLILPLDFNFQDFTINKNRLTKVNIINDYGSKIIKNKIGSWAPFPTEFSNIFVISYGASRRMCKINNLSDNNKHFFSSLHYDNIELLNTEEWYLQKYFTYQNSEKSIENKLKSQLEIIKDLIISFLPNTFDIRIKEVSNISEKSSLEILLENKEWVSLNNLSYGYQTMTALLVDISSKMMDKYPESKNPLAEPVIILIDEIDLHLHPKWQRLIIEKFSEYFPKAQFIVTSHSPLIVQAAKDVNANIVVCRKEGDHVVIDNNPEEVQGWRVDQILISDLFDSPTVRSKNDAEKMNKYYSLKAKSKLTKKEEAEVQELSQYLKKSFESDSPISDTEKKINQFLETHLK